MVPEILTEEQSPENLYLFMALHKYETLSLSSAYFAGMMHWTNQAPWNINIAYATLHSLIPPLSPTAHLHSDYLVCTFDGVLRDFCEMGKRVSVWKVLWLTSWLRMMWRVFLVLKWKNTSLRKSCASFHLLVEVTGPASCPWLEQILLCSSTESQWL